MVWWSLCDVSCDVDRGDANKGVPQTPQQQTCVARRALVAANGENYILVPTCCSLHGATPTGHL